MIYLAPSHRIRDALAGWFGADEAGPGTRAEKRSRRRWRYCLVFSLLFHLSMITVFEIVIVFPRHDPFYYDVSIISTETQGVGAAMAASRSSDNLSLSGGGWYDAALPSVALPVIEFAELERLRIRYDASGSRSDEESLFQSPAPPDSWARFGGELKKLGQSLRSLTLPEEERKAKPKLTHRPAEGYEAHVEWTTAPRDRELLFAPPIQALWTMRPEELERPVEIVFKAAPDGRVVNVWSPLLDQSELLEEIQLAVLQYRFAPLSAYESEKLPSGDLASMREQSGVLIIRPTRGAP